VHFLVALRRFTVRTPIRLTWLSLVALVSLIIGSLGASANVENVLVGASGMLGIQLDTWAAGEISPIAQGQQLRLSRLHFEPCTGIVLHNNGGSVLIYSESAGVKYVFQGGESYPDTPLDQSESVTADKSDYLTIVNDNPDPAYSSDLLVLSVTEDDSFVDVPMIEQFEFRPDSGCDGINANSLVTPTVLAEGIASETGDMLYLGSAIFQPGATTEGWGLINPGSSFNLVLSAGGMDTAGPNSGRAAFVGPGGVLHDEYLGEDAVIPSLPFVNNSQTPIFGFVFGTVKSPGSVWLPAG
jgi:hypothetical protein